MFTNIIHFCSIAIKTGYLPWSSFAKIELAWIFFREFARSSLECIDDYIKGRELLLTTKNPNINFHEIDDSFHNKIIAFKKWIKKPAVENKPEMKKISGVIKINEEKSFELLRNNESKVLRELRSILEIFKYKMGRHCGDIGWESENYSTEELMAKKRNLMISVLDVSDFINALDQKNQFTE